MALPRVCFSFSTARRPSRTFFRWSWGTPLPLSRTGCPRLSRRALIKSSGSAAPGGSLKREGKGARSSRVDHQHFFERVGVGIIRTPSFTFATLKEPQCEAWQIHIEADEDSVSSEPFEPVRQDESRFDALLDQLPEAIGRDLGPIH